MATLFNGLKNNQVYNTRLSKIRLASPTTLMNHATEAIDLGLRQDASIKYKLGTVNDVAGRKFPNAVDYDIDAKGLQTSFDDIRNALVLSKNFHQFWGIDGGGQNWYFKNNAGGATASGSSYLGMTFKFAIDKNSRTIEYKWMTRLFNHEHDWLINALNVTPTGETGTPPVLGLTANVMDRDDFRESNFIDVLIDGASVGMFDDAKLEFSSNGPKDNRERVSSNMLTVKGEITLRQTAKNDFLAGFDASKQDYDINYLTPQGETFSFIGGAISTNTEATVGDKENMQKLIFEGEIPYNISEATPNSIDLGVTTPDLAEFHLIGY